jgi:uncharacterized membrane protein (DUF106 family)
MDVFNHLICVFFDVVCAPLKHLHPLWGLLALSVVTGVVMLLIFRLTSNQKGIQKVKSRIKAHFFEIRLFNDDLGLMLEAQKNILKANLTYMKYSLKPMLFLIIPVVLIMIQLSVRFDRHALNVGESAIVKLAFKDSASFDENVILKVPEGVEIETPPLRMREEKEVDWRIKADRQGTFELEFGLSSGVTTKQLVVDNKVARLSAKRVSKSLLQQLLYPAEKSIPDYVGIDYIEITYPAITYTVFGWSIHWLVIFFAVSIVAGFMLKGFFRVEI